MPDAGRIKLTGKIQKAIELSCRLHRDQARKGDPSLPYVCHPFSVAWKVGEYTADEEVIAAALLHDVLEDVPGYGPHDLARDFGPEVAAIVRGVTEDKAPGRDDRYTWEARKRAYLRALERESEKALLLCAADKIHNLRSIAGAYEERGEALWGAFNAPPEKKLWFYEEVLRVLKWRLKSAIVEELEAELGRLRALYGKKQ